MRARSMALAIILALCISVVQAGEVAQAEDVGKSHSTLERIVKDKRLRVGVVLLAPLAMLNKNNELIGLEVDVARRLAADLGVSLELVRTNMPKIIDGLTADRYDLVISGCSVTVPRALRVEFTAPYYHTAIRLVASKQAAPGKDLNYFNSPGVILGVISGHSEVAVAEKQFPKASLRFFENEDELLAALLAGKIPAAVVSDQLIRFNVAFHANKLYLPGGENLATEAVAIAVRKNDHETLHFLNSWLEILDSEGWIKARRAFWYEHSAWIKDIPGEFP